MALDYGTKRVGVAVTDGERRYIFPRETMLRSTSEEEVRVLRKVCDADGVDLLVVGLPINADGTEGPMAAAARDFGGGLAEGLGVPLEMVDERYTSEEAEEHLREQFPRDTRKRRSLRDRTAALIILKTWLEHGATP